MRAVSLLDTALARFADESAPGAFHDTADDAEALIRRPSDPADNASPAGASLLAGALLTASALAGADRADRYRAAAEQAVARAGLLIERAPRFAGHWCTVAEALLAGPIQVAVVGVPGEAGFDELRATRGRRRRPVARSCWPVRRTRRRCWRTVRCSMARRRRTCAGVTCAIDRSIRSRSWSWRCAATEAQRVRVFHRERTRAQISCCWSSVCYEVIM